MEYKRLSEYYRRQKEGDKIIRSVRPKYTLITRSLAVSQPLTNAYRSYKFLICLTEIFSS